MLKRIIISFISMYLLMVYLTFEFNQFNTISKRAAILLLFLVMWLIWEFVLNSSRCNKCDEDMTDSNKSHYEIVNKITGSNRTIDY